MTFGLPGKAHVSPPPPPGDARQLRAWWHQILREHGRYKCYAVFLALPADIETTEYLMTSAEEIDVLSGDNCLMIVLSDIGFVSFGSDRKLWNLSVSRHVAKGHSVKIAEIFGVRFDEFPCLVIFRDIRSPNHVKVSLQGLTSSEITQLMRSIFSIIQKAVSDKEDPLLAIEGHRNNQVLLKNGKVVIGKVGQFAGKTLEAAIEAWMKAAIK